MILQVVRTLVVELLDLTLRKAGILSLVLERQISLNYWRGGYCFRDQDVIYRLSVLLRRVLYYVERGR